MNVTGSMLGPQNISLFKSLTDSIPALIWMSGTDKKCYFFNRAWLDFTGRTMEQECGHGWAEGVHPDDYERCMSLYAAAFDKRMPLEMSYRLKRHDGVYRWILDHGEPNYDESGELKGYNGACIDIQEKVESDERLQHAQSESDRQWRHYEAILSNTPDLAYVIGRNHRFIYANENLLKIWGCAREDALGKTFSELNYEPGHAEMHDREIDQVIATRAPIRGEVPFTGTSGRRIYDYIFVPVIGKDGEVEAVAGTTRDVTERKNIEEALRTHSEQFETLINTAPLGIYLLDSDFRVRQVNPVAEPVFKDIPGGVIGRDFEEIMHLLFANDYADEIVAIFRNTLKTGETYFKPERAKTRLDTGVTEYYEWQLERITLPDSRYGLVCYFRNITAHVEIRQAIAEARDKAESANRAKSDFLANMSHEIRTPMNAIVGLSSILAMDSTLSGKQKEMVSTLQLSAQSLLGLINDLLDITKIDANQVNLEHIPFALDALISEIINVSEMKANEKSVSLSCIPSPHNQRRFMGDPSRIKQVLLNLVSNALKFTETGTVHIAIELTAHENHGFDNVHITVTDTGIGISANKLDGIFEKFTQADTSTTRKYGGTGLGLAISKNLAEIMGGNISVTSAQGKGSAFTLHLPLERVALVAASITPITASDSKPAAENHDHSRKDTVLLVEDYKPNVMIATLVLESLGYQCDTATNGIEALNKIRENRNQYIAVLMDVQMPEMDGFEATRIIRDEEKANHHSRLPIIAMTAHALYGDKERCIAAGMDQYISKPFQQSELESVLGRYSKKEAHVA